MLIWLSNASLRFVCYCGQGPTVDPITETFYVGPMHQPRERRGTGRCVRCICALCRVEEGL